MELRISNILLFLSLLPLTMACSSKGDPQNTSGMMASPYTWERQEGDAGESAECSSGGVSPSVGIVGGEPVLQNSWVSKGVVFIIQDYVEYGDHHSSICTGSLIDNNIVLTAAHCVDQSRFNPSNVKVYFTSQPDCDRVNNTLENKKRTAAAIRIHPLWDPLSSQTTNRGDVALVRISGKAPAHYIPLKLSAQFLTIPNGFPILITGFGMVNPNYYGDFGGPITLRIGEVPPITPDEQSYLAELSGANSPAEAAEFQNLPGNEMFYIDQTQGKGICGGDSGGPSIAKNSGGQFVVTGVASFVMNPRDNNALCAYVAAHTSVVYHKSWVEKTFLEIRNEDSGLVTPYQ